jgi:CNT family concentrative nucleoside transporter
MMGVAYLMSENRKAVNFRTVGVGVGLQILLGIFVFFTDTGKVFFDFLNKVAIKLLSFADIGAQFVFGPLALPPGTEGSFGFIIASQVLPLIIFFSSLMAVLYHLGIMQKVISFFAWIFTKFMKVSGAESLCASANLFVGFESVLTIRPFVEKLTRSEMMVVMTAGMATIASSVFGAYVKMMQPHFPNIAGHLITASLMSIPAAVVIAKILVPETKTPVTSGHIPPEEKKDSANIFDAAARGASEGGMFALNIGATLIAFVALVAMANYFVGFIGNGITSVSGLSLDWTLQGLLGYVVWPFSWLMGIPAADCSVISRLIGEKTIINEFVAYTSFSNLLSSGIQLSPRTVLIASYALCGFANFGSAAIWIGGIGTIVPTKRRELASLAIKCILGGTLAAFMTASVAGFFYSG